MTELYVFLAVLAAIVVAGYVLQLSWTGLRPPKNDDKSDTKTKTLWDWLALLIVPFVLGSGAYGINSAQADREKKREIKRQKLQDAIAQDTRRAGSLDSYLKQMSSLIADEDLTKTKNIDKDEDGFADAPIAALAQSLTLTVLRGLDGARKGEVAQFLAKSGLIPKDDTGVIDLYNADLRGAKLFDSFLSNAFFDGADMRGADLRYAWVDGASFRYADLRGANFSSASYKPQEKEDALACASVAAAPSCGSSVAFDGSCLSGTKFFEADLPRASFEESQARSIDFTSARLKSVNFKNAVLTNVTTDDTRFGKVTPKTFPEGWKTRGLSKKDYDEKTDRDSICNYLEDRAAP